MERDAFGIAMVMGILVGQLVFYLAVFGFVCWLLQGWIARIPKEHRKVEPGQVWLLLIPLFNLYWNFRVFPPAAESFDSYFKSRNETVESPLQLAKLFCWVSVACLAAFIPCLGMIVGPIAGLGSLVLLIVVLVKFSSLKDKIGAAPGAAAPPAPPAPPPAAA